MELTLPLGGIGTYLVSFLSFAGVYALLTLGLNLQWGYAGLFNLGVAGFFALGAYTAAILTNPPSPYQLGGFSLPFAAGLAGAMVVAGLVAWLVGMPTLRLRGDYLAIASIGIAELIRLVFKNESWLAYGVRGISVRRPSLGVVGSGYDLVFLAVIALAVLVVYVALERGVRSPWGRVLRAIREDEAVPEAFGKDVFRFRMEALVLGSMIMGLAGALYGYRVGFISPEAFDPMVVTFLTWVMLIAGGSGNNRGALLGAVVIWLVWSGTELLVNQLPATLTTQAGALRVLLMGLLLAVILLARPQGLLGEEVVVSGAVRRRMKVAASQPGPAARTQTRPTPPTPQR